MVFNMQVNMHEAKSSLSKLAEKAWEGEEIVIAKAGKPYLDLVPHKPKLKPRVPGALRGAIQIHVDFDAADDQITALFEGDQ